MFQAMRKSIDEWNQTTSERAKLQHTFVALAVLCLILAGLVGLVDYDNGQRLVAVALALAGIFLVNAITWALLSGLLLVRLNGDLPSQRIPKVATRSKANLKKSNK